MHMSKNLKKIEAVDLFCGIGGLTRGLLNQDIDVLAGVDNDSTCLFGYEKSNGVEFMNRDINKVTPKEIADLYSKKGSVKVLVGCAPCQPYSGLNPNNKKAEKMTPLKRFAEIIDYMKPDIVSMENVRGLTDEKKYPIFKNFLNCLKRNGYFYSYQVINTADYGIPQSRNRLVLLASRFKPIKLIDPTHKNNQVTVKDVISNLPKLRDGETDSKDPMHRARKLSDMNKKRIKATAKNGGGSESWSEDLILDCHKKESGKTYKSTVYGRMRWDDPSPTMTTHCTGLGNGRFGHPEQDRAISLREAAIFQTFPKNYTFYDTSKNMRASDVARFIGNAVPVKLGEVIAKSIKQHLATI